MAKARFKPVTNLEGAVGCYQRLRQSSPAREVYWFWQVEPSRMAEFCQKVVRDCDVGCDDLSSRTNRLGFGVPFVTRTWTIGYNSIRLVYGVATAGG
jgi:hypothetical protein